MLVLALAPVLLLPSGSAMMIMVVVINTTFNHNQRTPEEELDHIGGCPGWAECCTEYGYCHPKVFLDHDDNDDYKD